MATLQNLTGQKFGRLTAIKYLGNRKWQCKCECGNIIDVFTNNLTRGNTKSCGCLNSEIASKRWLKHGKADTRLFHIFCHMKQRCYNKSNKNYKNYGERGIKIYNDWLDNFTNFYDWAMNNGYKDNLTIDRINVNGNYEPNNCRWVGLETQNRNKRNNIQITYRGKTQPLKTWCIDLNLPYKTVFCRYKYLHWEDPVTLFETPVKVGNNQTLRGDKY